MTPERSQSDGAAAARRRQARIRALTPTALSRLERRLRLAARSPERSISRRVERGTAPLTIGQERLWFLDQLMPGDTTYNLSMLTRLDNASVPVVKRCLYELIRRHESLRTTIGLERGVPLQRIGEPFLPQMSEHDLRRVAASQRQAAWRSFTETHALRPFDLGRGPLIRVALYRLTNTEAWLQCVVHHIIADGWSLDILSSEIGALVEAYSRSRPTPLAPLDLQFGDYAVWQRSRIENGDLHYWRDRLFGAPAVLELPFSRPRPARAASDGASRCFTVGPDRMAAIAALCERQQTTAFVFLLAVFKLLLARFCGRDDIVVGVPFAGRSRAEVAPIVGFFVNTLPMRTDCADAATFRDLLGLVRETMLEAQAHQDLPFERLVGDLQGVRSLDHNPVFQVAFSLETGSAPGRALTGDGAGSRPASALGTRVLDDRFEGRSKFDMTVQLRPDGEGLLGVCEYRTDLYDDAPIVDFLRRYLALIDQCLAEPDRALTQIAIARADESVCEALSDADLNVFRALAPTVPASGHNCRIVDRHGLPLPPGVPGRLLVAAAADGCEWTATDLAARADADGRLRLVGPLADQVEMDGRRLDLGVLRKALRACSGLADARIDLAPAGDRHPMLDVTGRASDPAAARQQVLAALRAHLPWLDARYVRFRLSDAASRSGDGSADAEAPADEADARAPRTATEAAVLGAFLRVLGIEETGRDDNFFDLGGDSLKALRLIAALRERFGVDVPLVGFFEAATVAETARLIGTLEPVEEKSDGAPPHDLAGESAPASFGQEQIWLAHQASPADPLYNVPFMITMARPLVVEHLRRAFKAVLDRHAVLRSTFALGEDGLVQMTGDAAEVAFKIVDLAGQPARQQREAYQGAVEAEAMRPFDLENGPLIRACLFSFAALDHRLMLTVHHIVCDGRSAVILREEIVALYEAFEAGLPSPLADLPRHYADVCREQRRRLDTDRRAALVDHWNSVLADAPAVLDLPFARTPPARRSHGGQVLEFDLSPRPSAALAHLAASEAVTEAMALLACFKTLLYRYTGVSPVVVGNAVTGRRDADDEALVGYFANTVALCTGLGAELSFRQVLQRVRASQLDAFDHQELPFELLVEARAAHRVAGRHPVFQVMFAFQPDWGTSGDAVFGERRFGGRIAEARGTGTAKFDLTLAMTRHVGRFVGAVEYATDLFDRPDIERMIEHLRRLVAAAAADPGRPIGDLDYFDAPASAYSFEDGEKGAKERALEALTGVADWHGPGRLWIAAAPRSMAGRLGVSLARRLGASVFPIKTEQPVPPADLDGALVVADARAAPWQALLRSTGTPHRVLVFGRDLPQAVRRTMPDAWQQRLCLFHGTPAAGLAAWIGVGTADGETRWRHPDRRAPIILDDRNRPVPTGVAGRLCAADGTATGKRAVALDGRHFRLLGETGRTMMIDGRAVDLDRLERHLEEAETVGEAAIIAVSGRGRTSALLAFVTAGASGPPHAAALRRHLRRRAPAMAAVAIAFRLLAKALPRDGWGCVLRDGLSRRRSRLLPDRKAPAAALTGRLAALRDIWTSVLEVADFEAEEDFFDIGGTSLAAVQILARVRAIHGVSIGIDTFFAEPTLAGLDRLIADAPAGAGGQREPALKRVPRDPPPPLSFAQERLWFLDQFEPGASVYNVAEIIAVPPAPDVGAVKAALDELAARHEGLRTAFPTFGNGPVQLVLPPAPVPLEVIDVLSPSRLGERIGVEARRPFDLSDGPPLRACLFRPAGRPAMLLVVLHHIVTDQWSMQIIRQEFEALYLAKAEGRPLCLAHPPVQYCDYAVWQRRRLKGERLARSMRHWRAELDGAPTVLDLPADRPRPARQSFAGAARRLRLGKDVADALRAVARRCGATGFIAFLAPAVALLHRLTGQADLLIGTPVANRDRAELESVCGFFANTVLIRSASPPGEHFSALVSRLARTVATALAETDLPFEKLVEELQPRRDPSINPLFQVMFVHVDQRGGPQRPPTGPVATGDQTAQALDHRTSKFDLSLHVVEDDNGADVIAEYATALFEAATIERWLALFVRLAGALSAAPETPVDDHALMTADAAEAMMKPEAPAAGATNLHGLLRRWVERTPEAVAIEDGATRLTYEAFDRSAAALAEALVDRGVGGGRPVAIHVDRSHRFCIAVLAVLKAGGACLVLDPAYPEARLRLMLDDAGPVLVLTGEAAPSWLAEHWPCVTVPQRPAAETTCLKVDIGADDPAYVVYTSGSSGRPKGVVMPHGALANLMVWQCRRSGNPAPKTLQYAALGFDVAFQEMFATWAGGGTLVCLPEAERRSPEAVLGTVERRCVGRLFVPYVALDQLAREIARRGVAPPACLKEVITAGEALKITDDIAAWFDRSPHCRLFNQYGPAETHVATEAALVGSPRHWPVLPPIGTAIDGVAVFIADQRLRPLPQGLVGEIVIAGSPVAHGYLNRPEATAARFVDLPGNVGRAYRTGDIGRVDAAGRLVFLGRRDDQVKVRGFRIEPGEIETVAMAAGGVTDAVVVARGGSSAERHLVAFVVPEAGSDGFDTAPLMAHLRRTLPDPMRPGLVVPLAAIPLTPSGKHDRLALARMALPSAPLSASSVPARTDLERRIAAVWSDILRHGAVGVCDNFFELGGHSLSATRLAARLGEDFGVDLPVRAIFDAPTIEELSREIVVRLAERRALCVGAAPQPEGEMTHVA